MSQPLSQVTPMMTEEGLQVCLLQCGELDLCTIKGWKSLREPALEPDPCLSSCFTISSLRITPAAKPI
jgi:hypothetical protein